MGRRKLRELAAENAVLFGKLEQVRDDLDDFLSDAGDEAEDEAESEGEAESEESPADVASGDGDEVD
jgi:hypothetical protein